MIRFRYQKQFFLDDACLYFGIICLSAAMGLLVKFSESLYLNEALITHSLNIKMSSNHQLSFLQFHALNAAYLILIYTTIFFVKFSFLLFFRILVRRFKKMMVYWWTVLAIMIVAWPVSFIAGAILPCPHFDRRPGTAFFFFSFSFLFNFLLKRPKLMPITAICDRAFESSLTDGLAVLATTLDVATDILC